MPVVALLVSEGGDSPQPQKLGRGVCLDLIFKREDGEGRAMLAAQPEVLFTYPTPTGDYNKIRWPSLHDRVGRLTRLSPRDNHGKVVSVSVAIQRLRPDRRAAGVTRLGPDGCFL